MRRFIKMLLLILIILFLILFIYFFVGNAPKQKSIAWGIDFSQMQAEALKLNWKEVYSAMLEDLNVKNIKLHTQWDWVEGQKDKYYFKDIDWQISEAEKNNAKIIYVLGMKTGRWPECHIPTWANNLSEKDQQSELLKYITEVVNRYKDSKAITYWQVENEPFFNFGVCPSWYYKDDNFLKGEISLVKSLDPTRQIIISDSGEQSMWLEAGKDGDIVGDTMYRSGWAHITNNMGFYFSSPLPPVFYYRKAEIIKKIFGKDVICVELQAEPWTPTPFYNVPLTEQEKTMNLSQFKSNIAYAKQTGLKGFYLWGVEWWYWMKETKNQPQIWNEAKPLFNGEN